MQCRGHAQRQRQPTDYIAATFENQPDHTASLPPRLGTAQTATANRNRRQFSATRRQQEEGHYQCNQHNEMLQLRPGGHYLPPRLCNQH